MVQESLDAFMDRIGARPMKQVLPFFLLLLLPSFFLSIKRMVVRLVVTASSSFFPERVWNPLASTER